MPRRWSASTAMAATSSACACWRVGSAPIDRWSACTGAAGGRGAPSAFHRCGRREPPSAPAKRATKRALPVGRQSLWRLDRHRDGAAVARRGRTGGRAGADQPRLAPRPRCAVGAQAAGRAAAGQDRAAMAEGRENSPDRARILEGLRTWPAAQWPAGRADAPAAGGRDADAPTLPPVASPGANQVAVGARSTAGHCGIKCVVSLVPRGRLRDRRHRGHKHRPVLDAASARPGRLHRGAVAAMACRDRAFPFQQQCTRLRANAARDTPSGAKRRYRAGARASDDDRQAWSPTFAASDVKKSGACRERELTAFLARSHHRQLLCLMATGRTTAEV